MPTINKILIPTQRQRVQGVEWETVGNTDVGQPHEMAAWPDRTVHLFGTWGGATIVIQGSNDGTNWQTLRDPGGTLLSFTADGLKGILENPRFIRPSSSGGTGTDVDVIVYAKGETV